MMNGPSHGSLELRKQAEVERLEREHQLPSQQVERILTCFSSKLGVLILDVCLTRALLMGVLVMSALFFRAGWR